MVRVDPRSWEPLPHRRRDLALVCRQTARRGSNSVQRSRKIHRLATTSASAGRRGGFAERNVRCTQVPMPPIAYRTWYTGTEAEHWTPSGSSRHPSSGFAGGRVGDDKHCTPPSGSGRHPPSGPIGDLTDEVLLLEALPPPGSQVASQPCQRVVAKAPNSEGQLARSDLAGAARSSFGRSADPAAAAAACMLTRVTRSAVATGRNDEDIGAPFCMRAGRERPPIGRPSVSSGDCVRQGLVQMTPLHVT